MVWGMVVLSILGLTTQHDHIRPLPGSRVISDDERDGELTLSYRDAGSRVRKTIAGRIYSLEYEVSSDVAAEDVVEFFTQQAEGLEVGDVHRTAGNRVTFSFRRPDGGTTWCQVWATDGNYTLEIADEAAPRVEPARPRPPQPPPPTPPSRESDLETVAAHIVFEPGAIALPEGTGSTIDAVVARLRREPSLRVELRGLGGEEAFTRVERVREALLLFGIRSERVSTVVEDTGDDRVEIVLMR